ncbi:hypothetical protein MMC10_006957 [Thelotrema lepadinum]|nr:hypothetical protein [Thelotrema lepadinum]
MPYPRNKFEEDVVLRDYQSRRRESSHSWPENNRRHSGSDDDYDDEKPNHAREVVPVREVPILAENYYNEPNPFEVRTHRGQLHRPQDRIYGQEAYVEYERRPTPYQMHETLLEMQPRFQDGLTKKASSNKAFVSANSDKLCGIRYGRHMAVATSLRSSISDPIKSRRKDDRKDVEKFISLARPLATDVERWNNETRGETHLRNLQCAEYGALDQHQRGVYHDRDPTRSNGERHPHHDRRRSLTSGRDKQLRDMFHNREEVSIAIDIKRSTPSEACNPDDPRIRHLYTNSSTVGCNQVLENRHQIKDVVTRARKEHYGPIYDEDSRRNYIRY